MSKLFKCHTYFNGDLIPDQNLYYIKFPLHKAKFCLIRKRENIKEAFAVSCITLSMSLTTAVTDLCLSLMWIDTALPSGNYSVGLFKFLKYTQVVFAVTQLCSRGISTIFTISINLKIHDRFFSFPSLVSRCHSLNRKRYS